MSINENVQFWNVKFEKSEIRLGRGGEVEIMIRVCFTQLIEYHVVQHTYTFVKYDD